MKDKKVFFILAGLLSVAAWPAIAVAAQAGWGEGDYRSLVERFYANPQPRSLPAALKYFVNQQTLGMNENHAARAAGARFFAVLGDRHPEIWRHAEQLYDQGSWSERRVLLELFSRTQNEALKTSLRRWVSDEDDPDRRILLERCLLFGNPALEFLDRLPVNEEQLEEQWAVFFANGDVRVVENSLALLAEPAAEEAAAPHEQRLREEVFRFLLQRARVHLPVRDAVARILARHAETEMLLSLRQSLACQALHSGEFADFDRWLPAPWIRRLAPGEQMFFEAAAEVLQSRSPTAPGRIGALAPGDRVRAEWLRAHHAYLRLRDAEAAGRGQPLSDQGRELLLKAKEHLLQDQKLAVYSLWALEPEPPEPRAEIFYHLQLALRTGPQQRWLTLIRLLPEESQAQNGGRLQRWTGRNPQWISVESGFLDARLRQAVRMDDLAEWLEQQPPRSIAKVFSAGAAPRIRVVYGPTEETFLWNDLLEVLFPGQRHALENLTLDLDASTHRPVRIQAGVTVRVEGELKARGTVTQVFYEPGADVQVWLEGLR